jgi:hypothetical protein
MGLDDATGTQARFEDYTASLAMVLGHADRVRPFADYCVGLVGGGPQERSIAGVPVMFASRPSRRSPCGRCAKSWPMVCRQA